MTQPETLQCTIDELGPGKVVLEFDNRQTLVVPKKYLPPEIKEGLVLQVEFLTDALATKRRKNLARAILEEILNGA